MCSARRCSRQLYFLAMLAGVSLAAATPASAIPQVSNVYPVDGALDVSPDPTLELTAEVDAEVRDFFGEIVFDTVIPRDVAVSEAPSHGRSVIEYAPRSRGARAYIELCMEVMER
jgi:cellulose biosynthesis protein BcsQ